MALHCNGGREYDHVKDSKKSFLPAAYAIELYGKFYLLRQFDKSVDHYATEFSNLFIRVGLNETIDQLRARSLVSLDLSIGDELGMMLDVMTYKLRKETHVLCGSKVCDVIIDSGSSKNFLQKTVDMLKLPLEKHLQIPCLGKRRILAGKMFGWYFG
ncbi:DNA/RNA polymerases superfamily protein [Gossypium australe]|uniref:DNA/RNA polymerases superfamily protein n=1 Tax=Gossypium australe TaxID=47621 RepID=A0A5B6UYI6_9ROSI|nr:DNA/RNA polymerases superfamily protein [Gossypium australe]